MSTDLKKIRTGSVSVTIFLFYIILSAINITFFIFIIYKNQADLVIENLKLGTEIRIINLSASLEENNSNPGQRKDDLNDKDLFFARIQKISGSYFDNLTIFSKDGEVLNKSSGKSVLPANYLHEGIRAVSMPAVMKYKYNIQVSALAGKIFCYIPLSKYFPAGYIQGNNILLLEKRIPKTDGAFRKNLYQVAYVIIVILTFHLFFAFIIFRYIINPVKLIANGIKKFSRGDLNHRVLLDRNDEFQILSDSLNEMAHLLSIKNKALTGELNTYKERNNILMRLSVRDEITGLLNRRYLLERADEEIKRAGIQEQNTGLLLIEIDNFKEILKIYGQQTVNIIVTEAAKIITQNCAASDIAARIENSKFAVLSPGADLISLRNSAEKIKRALDTCAVITPDGKLSIAVNTGISITGSADSLNKNCTELILSAELAIARSGENIESGNKTS